MTATGPGGAPLHDVIAAAFVRAREAMRPHERRHADARLTEWLDAWEANMRDHLAPHLAAFADHPDASPEVRRLLADLTAPAAAFDTSILIVAIGALVYPLISAVMSAPALGLQNVSMAAEQPLTLSPPEVALGVIRETLGSIDAYQEASYAGLNRQRMDVMIANTGEVPAIQELLLLYRRGQISQARLMEGIHKSRIRSDWAPEILELRYAPPSPGEVLAGNVQGHLSQAEAVDKLQRAGIDPAEYQWLYDTHGRPPATQEMGQLVNRGFVSEADWAQAIRESDIKNKYIPAILKTRIYLPPVRSIPTLLRHNAITEAHARELFAQHGVQQADIDGYVKEAGSIRTAAHKEAAATQVMRAADFRLLTTAAASARLLALGYSQADADLLLQLADHARHERFVQAAVQRVHNLYVSHKITRAQATTLLDADAIPAPARDDWLTLWDHERAANVRILTEAQLAGALYRKAITDAEFRVGVLALGYAPGDVHVLAALAYPPTKQPTDLRTRFP